MNELKKIELKLEENVRKQNELLEFHIENPDKEHEVTVKMQVLGAEYELLKLEHSEYFKKEAESYSDKQKTKFKEGVVQKRTRFNQFEQEMRDWAKSHQNLYGFEILDGTVSDKEDISLQDHQQAQLSKGDIGFRFGDLEFYISQKMTFKNDYKVIVPSRVHKNLETLKHKQIWKNKLDYFILDANEIKEIRNKRGNEYLIYFDQNNGEYYLYCKGDILQFKFSEVYMEPEGGFLNLTGKYNQAASFHEKMGQEEGETKRKYVLQKTFLKFSSLEECMEWFFEYIVKIDIEEHDKQKEELQNPQYGYWKNAIKRYIEQHKDRFIYEPIITDNKVIIKAKQDVLLKVSDTQKEIYNDQVDYEYNLFDYKYLKMREKFEDTRDFLNYLIGKYIPAEMQTEADRRLNEIYSIKGELQKYITIVPPSTYKCKGATRKEAIQCQVDYEVSKVKLMKQ